MAGQSHLSVLRARGYGHTVVYTDHQSAFRTTVNDFPGVEIDVGRAGDYMDKVDAKVWHIKEM
jgi:hypothetical protein